MELETTTPVGEKMPSPEGRVVGFLPSAACCGKAVQILWAAGVPEAKIITLVGDEGLHQLEASQNDFFMGDGETEMIQRGIVELRDGHCILGVEVDNREEAARIATIAEQHGGHAFTYFGPLVSEQLTK